MSGVLLEGRSDRMRQTVEGRPGRAAMAAGNRKLRIAIAIFKSASGLGSAIEKLTSTGVAQTCLGLILSAATAHRMTADVQAGGEAGHALRRLLDDVEGLAAERDEAIVASPGLTGPWRDGLNAPGLWAERRAAEDEAGPRLATDLERHVRQGAAILTVVSPSPTEHWHCARILLEQSCAPILALECSLPAAT